MAAVSEGGVRTRVEPRRILIATLGSLGDLHPCLALGTELKRRGHQVTVASTPFYRSRVEALGLGFRGLRPDWDPTDTEIIRRCEDLKRGPEVLFRELVLPHLKVSYEDLLAAASDADLMIAGEIVYGAPLVAEKLGLRWVSEILSPTSFFSAHDPSILAPAPWMIHIRKAGWRAYRVALGACRLATRHWWNPVRELRREIGLSADCDPIFRDKFSPDLVLALFSRCLAQKQPDWPAQTLQTGFVYFDGAGSEWGSAKLEEFLAEDEAPIVFTLGSTAVHNPGDFYEVSIEAAKRLGRRAILIGANGIAGASQEIFAMPYAPYSEVFPHAAAIVHQGGSGTTGQALRAGRPMLIVPYGWDQPDNGARVQRTGAGFCLPRAKYSASSAAETLARLLGDTSVRERAAEVGARVGNENGLTEACNAIETVIERSME